MRILIRGENILCAKYCILHTYNPHIKHLTYCAHINPNYQSILCALYAAHILRASNAHVMRTIIKQHKMRIIIKSNRYNMRRFTVLHKMRRMYAVYAQYMRKHCAY